MERKYIENLNANLRQIQTKLKEIFRPVKLSSARFAAGDSTDKMIAVNEMFFEHFRADVANVKQNLSVPKSEKNAEIQKHFSMISRENKVSQNSLVREILRLNESNTEIIQKKSKSKIVLQNSFTLAKENMVSVKQKINSFMMEKNLRKFVPLLSSSQDTLLLKTAAPANATLGKILLTEQIQKSEQKISPEKENISKEKTNVLKRNENIIQLKNNIYIDGELRKTEVSTKRAGN